MMIEACWRGRARWGSWLGLTGTIGCSAGTAPTTHTHLHHHAPLSLGWYYILLRLQILRSVNTASQYSTHPVTTHTPRYSRHTAVCRASHSSDVDHRTNNEDLGRPSVNIVHLQLCSYDMTK